MSERYRIKLKDSLPEKVETIFDDDPWYFYDLLEEMIEEGKLEDKEYDVKFPTKLHTIGNPKYTLKQLVENEGLRLVGPDGHFFDLYIQEAVNPKDKTITHYVGYTGGDDGPFQNDKLVLKYLINKEYDKALKRAKKLFDDDEIVWFACREDDPTGDAYGEQVDKPE